MSYTDCALNSKNLEANASGGITASDHFNVVSYNGAYDSYNYVGTSSQSITGVGFKPELVFIKDRDNQASGYGSYYAYGGYFFDAIQGSGYAFNPDAQGITSGSNSLSSAEDGVTSFDTDGFTVDEAEETSFSADTDYDSTPDTPERYIAWCWKLGSTGSSSTWASGNTDPDSEKYNADSGVSVLSYTDSSYSSGSVTLNHSLGGAPDFALAFDTGGGFYNHYAWHKGLAANKHLDIATSSSEATDSTVFPSGGSTSTTFQVGSTIQTGSGYTFYLYLFRAIEGFSSFGTFSGGGFAYCGFRPKAVWYKRTDSSGDWVMLDTVRNSSNPADKKLALNSSSSESTTTTDDIDITSTGFKHNTSGGSFVYCAWADLPSWAANAT